MTQWPKDTTEAKNAFYGNFQSKVWQDTQLTHMFAPFNMFYEKQLMKHGLLVHHLIVPALTAAFAEIWNKCSHDQKAVDATGASDWGGCWNIRRIAGSDNSWSNHSWACATDLSPGTNGFNMKPTIGNIVIAAFKGQGARWGGDYVHRKDPMHFEFVSPV